MRKHTLASQDVDWNRQSCLVENSQRQKSYLIMLSKQKAYFSLRFANIVKRFLDCFVIYLNGVSNLKVNKESFSEIQAK